MVAERVQGTIVYASEAFQRLFGHAPAALEGRDGFELVHPEDRPRVSEAFGNMVRHDRELQTTYRLQAADGTWRTVESSARPLSGRAAGQATIIATTRDITARVQAEQDVRAARALARGTLEAIQDGVMAVDLTGQVTLHNRRFLEMWGFARETLDRVSGWELTQMAARSPGR